MLFHIFYWILKSVKYVSGLMYFVVLDLQKVIKNRYILVMKFMFFPDPHFYWFSIDFWRPWGLQKWSLGATGARPGPKWDLPKSENGPKKVALAKRSIVGFHCSRFVGDPEFFNGYLWKRSPKGSPRGAVLASFWLNFWWFSNEDFGMKFHWNLNVRWIFFDNLQQIE